MRHTLKALDKVKESRREVFASRRCGLGAEGRHPCSPLRAAAEPPINGGNVIGGLPMSGYAGSCPPPYPNDGGQKANGPQPPIGFRQEHD